jgi:hypothetical protein
VSVLVALVLGAGLGLAQPVRPGVAILMSPCAREIVDGDALVEHLRVELGTSIELVGADATPPAGGYRLTIDCPGPGAQLSLISAGTTPERVARTTVNLDDAPPSMRVRTFALAVAEQLQRLDAITATQPPPVPAPSARAAVAPSRSSSVLAPVVVRNDRRLRLSRGFTLGLASLTVVSIAIGAPLLGVARSATSNTGSTGELNTGGIVMLSIAAASFLSSGVTLALWLRDRASLLRVSVVPSAQQTSLLLSGSF